MNIDAGRSWVALLGTALLAVMASAVAADEEAVLRVKPQLCITGKRGQACEAHFLLQWEASDDGSYCLGDDVTLAPLRCWQQESTGRFGHDRVVERSFSYQLTSPGSEFPLAEARVELMSLDSPDRRRSRRNRHAWSIR